MMSANAVLRSLRPWLTPHEAGVHLSAELSDTVTSADVYRLALDGLLTLSVHFPHDIAAEVLGATAGASKKRQIQGLFDLVLDGSGRLQIESVYSWLKELPFVSVKGHGGATVQRGGERFRVEPDRGESGMWPRAASTLPQGAVIVVRMEALNAIAVTLAGLKADLARAQEIGTAGSTVHVTPASPVTADATPAVAGTSAVETAGTFTPRTNRERVDAYLSECREAGVPIKRRDIWSLKNRYTNSTQFQRWQRNTRVTKTAYDFFEGVLREKPHLLKD